MDHQHCFGPKTSEQSILWSFSYVDQTLEKVHTEFSVSRTNHLIPHTSFSCTPFCSEERHRLHPNLSIILDQPHSPLPPTPRPFKNPISSTLRRCRASKGRQYKPHMGGLKTTLISLLTFSIAQWKTQQIWNHLQNRNLG